MPLAEAGAINSHQSEDGIDWHLHVGTQPLWSRALAQRVPVVVKGARLIGAEPKGEEVARAGLT